MQPENLAYALTQLLHNFGAVAVTGGAVYGLMAGAMSTQREVRLALLVAAGWTLQMATGLAFATVSFYFYGQLPDLHGIATAALTIKIVCAIAGLTLSIATLTSAAQWSSAARRRAWHALAALGATALAAAAFLRWFS